MKKTIVFSFLGIFLFSLAASNGFAQSVEDILQKLIETQGGKKTLESIEDTTMSGTIELPQMGLSGNITVYKKEPDKRRVDVEVMGMLITQAYDGSMAWWVNPQTGATEEMPETQAASMRRESMPSISILNPKKYGLSHALKGKEQIDGKDHFVLEQTYSDGFKVTLYIDSKTYLTTKTKGTQSSEVGEVELEQYASDYKKVNGMMIPHSITTYQNGAEYMKITLTEIKFNTGLEDSFFKMN
jgi:outer membrane lipoprotein-sorting protein